ncbi:MAG: acyl-CoA thioesterase [Chloroflexota bacterium]|nr:acyl-CoA thioesterase [Chloroflexota bacterium]
MSDGTFPFAIRQRVRFAETDMQGVVYYANYLVYAEVGRSAFLRYLGIERDALHKSGLDFAIGEASVRYHAPLRYDEEFDVRVRVGEVRGVSWALHYAVDRADGLRCADMTTMQVVYDPARAKAVRIPDDVRTALAGGAP